VRKVLGLLLLLITLPSFSGAESDIPLTVDNRIKTYTYNENDVYKLLVNYGYQTVIEFSKNEKIVTISLGDNYSWKITPSSNRLFIKPMEENINTNMTVITNKRTYHFDLFSEKLLKEKLKELVYVLRFFYPSEEAKVLSEE
jgi:type IV secretion system protein VirB9